MTKPHARRSARSLGLAVAAIGSLLVLGFFLFIDLGGTMAGLIHPVSFLISVAWAVSFWVYALLMRTQEGALIGGAGLLVATTGFLVSMFSSSSSTASIGIVTYPMFFLYPLAGLTVAIDWLFWRGGEGH